MPEHVHNELYEEAFNRNLRQQQRQVKRDFEEAKKVDALARVAVKGVREMHRRYLKTDHAPRKMADGERAHLEREETLLRRRELNRQKRAEWLRRRDDLEELAECTFQPTLSTRKEHLADSTQRSERIEEERQQLEAGPEELARVQTRSRRLRLAPRSASPFRSASPPGPWIEAKHEESKSSSSSPCGLGVDRRQPSCERSRSQQAITETATLDGALSRCTSPSWLAPTSSCQSTPQRVRPPLETSEHGLTRQQLSSNPYQTGLSVSTFPAKPVAMPAQTGALPVQTGAVPLMAVAPSLQRLHGVACIQPCFASVENSGVASVGVRPCPSAQNFSWTPMAAAMPIMPAATIVQAAGVGPMVMPPNS